MALDPAEVERWLLVLGKFHGDRRDMGVTIALMTAFDPHAMMDALEDELVYLARYLRQDIEYLEQQPLSRLRHWADVLSGYIRAERGVGSPQDPSETDYT